MNLKKLEQQITEFLAEINYELYAIEFEKKKKNSILRIYIDSPKGITMDDCVFVTQKIDPYLDEIDPIEESYMLEVSSPGAEKELRNEKAIKNAIGKYVHVETYEQTMEGYLEDFDGDKITLKIKNKKVGINYIDVNFIRLAIKF